MMKRATFSVPARVALGGLLVLTLGGAPAARANHESACNHLPTSAMCPGTVNFNPRQECHNAIPGHVQGPARDAAKNACNKLSTSGSRPGQVSCNPRAECVSKLPPPPTVSVTSVTPNNMFERDTMTVLLRGNNVGLPGATYAGVGGSITVTAASLQTGCAPPNCVALTVTTSTQEGMKHIKVTAPSGHSSAQIPFEVKKVETATAPRPATGSTGVTPVGGGGPVIASGTSTPAPAPKRQVHVTASTQCHKTITIYGQTANSGLPYPSEEFEVRSAQVTAYAGASYNNSRVLVAGVGPVVVCQNGNPNRWTITSTDGRNANVQLSFSSVNGGGSNVTLRQGRWKIIPDAGSPIDYTFSVRFEE